MKKSFLTSLCALCTLFLIPSAVKATDYTVEPTTAIKSNTIPYFRNSNGMKGSVTQQIYLPSEFAPSGASAGNITDITFYYASKDGSVYSPNTANACTRQVEIYLMETSVNSYTLEYVDNTWKSKFLCNGSNKAGTKVYDGNLTTNEVTYTDPQQSVTLHLDAPFAWDGVSNIVLTLYDKSSTPISENTYNNLKFYITETSHARFVHYRWLSGSDDDRSSWISNINRYGDTYGNPSVKDSAGYASKRVYVPKTTFSIVTPIPAPTSPTSSSITSSSATIGWTAAAGAESYEVRYGTTSGSLGDATNVGNVTSYNLSELEDGVTYYFQIRTKIGTGYSAWTDEAHFETPATTIDYKDIDFSKWTSTTTMPTSGAYYLRNNVGLSASVTLEGNLQLCLHGKTLYTSTYHIIVPDGKTLSIFNDTGDGLINGGFLESLGHGGIIEIQDGGTLIISEGQVMNVAANDSYAIYNNGNLQLSGAPIIVGESAGIYLGNSKIITISGELTNSTPYSVNKALVGDFTSGWNTNMGSANPADYFSSANASFGVARNGNEARMVKALDWYESTSNSSIGDNSGQMVNVSMTRSILTSAHYNTICLPFALSAAQMEEIFGAGYDLEEFVSASLNEGILNLLFNQVDALVAGKPYLLKPAISVTNPSFEGVTIGATSPVDQTSDTYVSFHGTFAPTELTGGNKNILFLGANNELFWPTSTGNINGFRAYFVVKGAAANAVQARIGRAESQTTAIENQHSHIDNHKYMKDGQLLIERNGVIYNAQGQTIK